MSDFDDDEYESFDLDAADKPAAPATTPAQPGSPDEDDDLDDDDDDDDEDDDDDDLDDATDDEIDYVLAAYREDGRLVVPSLAKDLANDLDELIVQLRRLPGDGGALGFVSLVEELFVVVRVRGPHVQVLLSDGAAAGDWPLAHDVADFLGVVIPDEVESDPMGDLGFLADLGLSEFEMGAIIDNLDLTSDQMLAEIAARLNLNPQFRTVAEAAFHD